MRQCMPGWCPHGLPRDTLWVKEAHYILDMRPDATDHPDPTRPTGPCPVSVQYRADSELEPAPTGTLMTIPPEVWRPSFDNDHTRWRSSIHMPRWACRLRLLVKSVRVERVQEITEADAIAEGIEAFSPRPGRTLYRVDQIEAETAKLAFEGLWEQINGEESWAANPWVWVIEYERIKPDPLR